MDASIEEQVSSMLRHRRILHGKRRKPKLAQLSCPHPFQETSMPVSRYVIDQPRPAETPFPGILHATWAGQEDGLGSLSLWRQSMAPGSCTPPHSHQCEEIVLCVAGRGEVHIEGGVHAFGPDQTLLLPANVPHQIFNVGDVPLETTAVFAATPVAVALPDGAPLELPWRS
jgi:mannose-6-phosphate isomerase-like protein (cupin superfamily)